MENSNDTKNQEGLRKLRELLKDTKITMMATNLQKVPFSICPMTLQQMDEQGDLWFFTAKDSDHFREIENDNRVQIIVSNESEQRYLSIFGNAVHMMADNKVDELWNPMLNTWFDGKDDPNLALLNVNVENAQYWDTDSNKLVSFYDMGKSATMDKNPVVGKKGHIDLQSH
ncbi:hypothetical protein LCGC14_1014650 [marine sediment metagenome]|uniref:General stress protein n=2 Tax=root TaxID=1 RepID=A0A831QKA8_9FLAO|nr:general stress protein [Pricia antarctica]